MKNRIDNQLVQLKEKRKLISRIKESIDDSSELSEWEIDFLGSVYTQLTKNQRDNLSDAQADILEKIEFKRAEGAEAYWEEYGHED